MTGSKPANPPSILSSEELSRLCDYLYRLSGISYDETKRFYIERRVAERMALTSSSSFSSYMALLRSNSGEAEHLINIFTVNETYFYREDHQLRCLTDDILPEVIRGKAPGDLVRIWCVPCSTGEEPYSVAIWLLENWPLVDAYHIDIVGSDIDTRVLAAARRGQYGERALSRLPVAVREEYFSASAGGSMEIIPDLRESVTFTQVNLLDPWGVSDKGPFDIIFCRNVLIYFDDASRLATVNNLSNALKKSGFICLGHSESMSRISLEFSARHFKDAIVYQRSGV